MHPARPKARAAEQITTKSFFTRIPPLESAAFCALHMSAFGGKADIEIFYGRMVQLAGRTATGPTRGHLDRLLIKFAVHGSRQSGGFNLQPIGVVRLRRAHPVEYEQTDR